MVVPLKKTLKKQHPKNQKYPTVLTTIHITTPRNLFGIGHDGPPFCSLDPCCFKWPYSKNRQSQVDKYAENRHKFKNKQKNFLCLLYYNSSLYLTIFFDTENGDKRRLVTSTRLCDAQSRKACNFLRFVLVCIFWFWLIQLRKNGKTDCPKQLA